MSGSCWQSSLALDLFAAKLHVHSAFDNTIKAGDGEGVKTHRPFYFSAVSKHFQASNAEIIKLRNTHENLFWV